MTGRNLPPPVTVADIYLAAILEELRALRQVLTPHDLIVSQGEIVEDPTEPMPLIPPPTLVAEAMAANARRTRRKKG